MQRCLCKSQHMAYECACASACCVVACACVHNPHACACCMLLASDFMCLYHPPSPSPYYCYGTRPASIHAYFSRCYPRRFSRVHAGLSWFFSKWASTRSLITEGDKEPKWNFLVRQRHEHRCREHNLPLLLTPHSPQSPRVRLSISTLIATCPPTSPPPHPHTSPILSPLSTCVLPPLCLCALTYTEVQSHSGFLHSLFT